MTSLGFDLAGDNQPLPRVNYPMLVAAGRNYMWAEYVRGIRIIPGADAHRAAMRAAGGLSAGYVNISHGDTAGQMRLFLKLAAVGELPDMLDAEESTLTEADLRAACDEHDRSGRAMVIYTGYWAWLKIVPLAARAYYKKYKLVIGSYPNDTPANQPVPMDPASVLRRSTPPAAFPKLPGPWLPDDLFSHQYTGQGSAPGYAGLLDLHQPGPAFTSGEQPMTNTSTGVLVGFHTQGNSSAVPIAADYAAASVRIPIMLADEDGGKAIDTQNTVKTRVTRLQFAESGDDHDFEGGGSGRLGWSEEKKLRYLAGIEHMLTVRLGIGELNAATHLQLGSNEWDAQDVGEWLATFDLLARVVDKVNEVSSRLQATKGLAHPLRLALPAFNAGTPKTWAMYQAISQHPIWRKLAAQGGAILFHEGIAFDQPFDWGANMPVEPGAPQVDGAGLVNMRAYNLLHLLKLEGIEIDWAVGEWYDGRKRADDIEARIDNMIRMDRLLAPSAWARRCLGYCTYELTNDPGSPWWEQDFTAIWRHPRWKAHCISVKDRVNGPTGDTIMADIKAAQAAIAAAQTQLNTALTALSDAPTWTVGDVVLATVDPFNLYSSPAATTPAAVRHNYQTTDQHVLAVSADGKRLKVFANPEFWVNVADVKLKV